MKKDSKFARRPPMLMRIWLKVFFATYTVVAVAGGALTLVLVPLVSAGRRLKACVEKKK